MKIIYLIILFDFILSGCGSSNDSRPSQDGKGEIDIVKYLPAEAITKHFSYGHSGSIMFGGKGYQNITIENNKINIEEHAHSTGRYYVDDVVQYFTISYNEDNVTNLLYNDVVAMIELKNKRLYRHVDIEELLAKDTEKEEGEYSIYKDDKKITIGRTLYEKSYECFYKNVVTRIKNRYDELVRDEGDFLVIQCNTSEKETYHIDEEYRDISDKHNKVNLNEVKFLYYYEKGIGLVFYTSIENDDINSGHTYTVTSVE